MRSSHQSADKRIELFPNEIFQQSCKAYFFLKANYKVDLTKHLNKLKMKRTILILIGIALLSLLLVAQLLFKQNSDMTDERRWFTNALRYEFSGQVDTVFMFNQNSGRLQCLLTQGDPQIYREDSLKRLFQEHDMLYLIFKRSADTITFILPNHANMISKGDSVQVSSRGNFIKFFRVGKLVMTDSLTETLTGFSRPFFMKKKK
jgi:hypothetical protein